MQIPNLLGFSTERTFGGSRSKCAAFSTLVIVLISSNNAYADVGLPMIFLGLPFAGLALVPIILIESLIFSRKLGMNFRKTLIPVGVANLVSTLFGYPLSWLMLLAVELLTTGGSDLGISTFWQKFKAVTLQAAWLIPYEEAKPWMVPAAGLTGLLVAFPLSVIIEKWVLKKYYWKENENLKSAVFRANVFSYVFLSLILMANLITHLF